MLGSDSACHSLQVTAWKYPTGVQGEVKVVGRVQATTHVIPHLLFRVHSHTKAAYGLKISFSEEQSYLQMSKWVGTHLPWRHMAP